MEITSLIANILRCLTLVAITEAQVKLKTCSRDNQLNCPRYSRCSPINNGYNENLKCICIDNFQLNPNWLEYEHLNSSAMWSTEHYCISSVEVVSKAQESKLIVFMRSPARKEHLAFGILMVLLAAALACIVLYGVKVLKPLKRTKCIYQKLKNKQKNIIPLQEMDELELNRRFEMETL